MSNPAEKIKFIFDLFDIDRDSTLNKQEFKLLLETSVKLFRKFTKNDPEQKNSDQTWIDTHLKTLFKEGIHRINFEKFKPWAEVNLNIYHLINSFEVVPSPSKERLTIMQILQKEEQKHGDTMYVLNYRWWDSWKNYTSTH